MFNNYRITLFNDHLNVIYKENIKSSRKYEGCKLGNKNKLWLNEKRLFWFCKIYYALSNITCINYMADSNSKHLLSRSDWYDAKFSKENLVKCLVLR